LFFTVERALLKRLDILRRQAWLRSEVFKRLTQKSRRADGTIVDALANAGLHDLDDGADERARSVVLAAVAPGVAHGLNLGFVVVEFPVLVLGRGPAIPPIWLVEDVAVLLASQRGFRALVLLKIVEVFQEQQPGRLLSVIELSGAAGFLAEHVVDVFEGLLE